MPTEDEINEVMNQCIEAESDGRSRWPGMSYEQGVLAAIRWLKEGDCHPLED